MLLLIHHCYESQSHGPFPMIAKWYFIGDRPQGGNLKSPIRFRSYMKMGAQFLIWNCTVPFLYGEQPTWFKWPFLYRSLNSEEVMLFLQMYYSKFYRIHNKVFCLPNFMKKNPSWHCKLKWISHFFHVLEPIVYSRWGLLVYIDMLGSRWFWDGDHTMGGIST